MIFKFNEKDKSCNIIFSWKEVLTLLLKRKIYLDKEGFKKFGAALVGMVSEWHIEEVIEKNKNNKEIE